MAKNVAAAGPVEGPWTLPDGWRWERLGDVCQPSQYGWTTKAASSGETKFLRTTDISSGRVDWSTVPYCADVPSDLERYRVKAGDILISRAGSVGKSFLIESADDAVFASYLIRFRPYSVPRYIHHWLQTDTYWSMITENTAGIAIPNVNASKLSDLPVPMSPPHLRERLVARIDELFAEVDDGEAALARARDDLATWRKALLQAAVTGELTADWRAANPSAETGPKLLARILADRRSHWGADLRNEGKRYADAAKPMVREMPDPPANWTWVGIEQLTTGGIRNGLSLKEANEPTAVKGLKLDALQPNGIDWSRARHLPIDLDRAAPYLLRTGDLLISRANGSPEFVGRCTMVDEGRDDTVFPDTAIRYPIVDEPRLRAWARLAWSAPQSRKRMLALAKSTAGILKISQGDIAAVALPLPPLAEIDEIVTRVERLTAEAEAGADDLVAMKSLPASLRQSVLAAAFRGDLA